MHVTAAYLGFCIVELLVHSCILHCVMGYCVSWFLFFKKWVHILVANNMFSLTGIYVSSVSSCFIVQVTCCYDHLGLKSNLALEITVLIHSLL
jgi:hypothetical protein